VGKASFAVLLVADTLLCACGSEARRPTTATLPSGTLAVVGGDVIGEQTVRRIAEAQVVTPRVACERAVFDALLARSAGERLGSALITQAMRGVAARALLEDFARQASERGPPTDAELAAATERHFSELDRPALLRTTHAVVLVKKPEDDARARALADRVAAAVAGVHDPAVFRARALAVPGGGLDLRVEDLKPVTRDGRVLDPAVVLPPGSAPERYSATYVDAAYAIPDVGRSSPVVKTEFGYHVILAVERIPEQRVPLDERRRLLSPEILAGRAEKMRDETLATARAARPVDIERAAMELTEHVRFPR